VLQAEFVDGRIREIGRRADFKIEAPRAEVEGRLVLLIDNSVGRGGGLEEAELGEEAVLQVGLPLLKEEQVELAVLRSG